MLAFLKIKNIALIDSLSIEFGPGLNLLTGETGSGKSIIVDSLEALTGRRISADLIKEGEDAARIEGLFDLSGDDQIRELLDENGVDADADELIIRRELSSAGKNRIFINDQIVTAAVLKRLGPLLVDIHGQGEQASLYGAVSHLELLDLFAEVQGTRETVAAKFAELTTARRELAGLEADEAEKFQLLDILRFQVEEIRAADLKPSELASLEEEKLRLNNVEKLSALSSEAAELLYDDDRSTITTLDLAALKIAELAEFDSHFSEFREGLTAARGVVEEAAAAARDLGSHLEFSPERINEIEDRLAAIGRITRKYGGTIESSLEHLAASEMRLENIVTSEEREADLRKKIAAIRTEYIAEAGKLSDLRRAAAKNFQRSVELELGTVALEKARFEVAIGSENEADRTFTAKGFDRVQFLFSANAGESPKPLAKVASGGEASRLMLILKTVARSRGGRATVFDEVDAGIGGRVAEAVGVKLKELSASQQVLCVTHQPQVASKADRHFVVEKTMTKNRTEIGVRALSEMERIEEVARMLAGETITEAARENAREMLAAA